MLCWVALSFSLAPLLPRLLLWVSGGSCCLPCAAAWRAARLLASLLLGVLARFASRPALTALFWQWWFFCVGGFPLLGVDLLVSLMSILV